MLLTLPEHHQVLFVAGKGGVGKTVLASTIALARAEVGARVLLVSTDPAHSLGHLWQREVGDAITALGPPGLYGLEIDPTRTTEQHVQEVQQRLEPLVPDRLRSQVRRHLRLARQAPGTFEAALLERVAGTLEEQLDQMDLVVFDTAPSGHTIRLVSLPETMSAWTNAMLDQHGRSQKLTRALQGLDGEDPGLDLVTDSDQRGRRSDRDSEIRRTLLARQERLTRLRELLQDARRTAFVAVLVAERLPMLETIDLVEQLDEARMQAAALVVNKRSPVDAGDLLARRRRQEQDHLQMITSRFPDLPLVQLPLLGDDIAAPAGLHALATALKEAPDTVQG